jgi:D-serine deaminase-like pyridoxal phosphate-dependent protein
MFFTKPTLLIDPDRVKHNLQWAVNKANKHNVLFRPHFKTHQSRVISHWFQEAGVDKITVSSIDMARYFSSSGWKDILVAFPVNVNEIKAINQLANGIKLSLIAENQESVSYLNKNLTNNIDVYIKIDAGHRRTGILWENNEEIEHLAEFINQAEKLTLKGVLTHAGHTYKASSPCEIVAIHEEVRNRLSSVKRNLNEIKDDLIISVGDTPGFTLSNDFREIDEVRPGNFIFYDLQQYKLGVCQLDDIGVCMACPIVSKHKERTEIVIYGGAVHFSKDIVLEADKPVYGYGVNLSDENWVAEPSSMILTRLSQEHGIISTTPEVFSQLRIGDFIGVLPVHSCLTANVMQGYADFKGNIYDHMSGKGHKYE